MAVPIPESNETRLARLEERQSASDRAAALIATSLAEYKTSANEWRQALNDQRVGYVTRTEMVAAVIAGMALIGLIMRMLGK